MQSIEDMKQYMAEQLKEGLKRVKIIRNGKRIVKMKTDSKNKRIGSDGKSVKKWSSSDQKKSSRTNKKSHRLHPTKQITKTKRKISMRKVR